jgi:hypothetical protein
MRVVLEGWDKSNGTCKHQFLGFQNISSLALANL